MANPIDYFGDISLHGGALKEVKIEMVGTLPTENLEAGRIVLFNNFIQFYDGANWVVLGDPADLTALGTRVTTVEGKVTILEGKVKTLEDKMATIEEGAEVNIIETVKVDGSPLPVDGKAVNIDLSAYAKKADLTTVFKWLGTKATFDALPASGNTVGDVYHVEAKSAEYVWNGTTWEELGSIVDLSDYYNKKAIDDKVKTINDTLATKVDKLAVSETRAGTYTKVTINAEGQVESGQAQITIADISNIANAEVKTAENLATARNINIAGGATATAVAFDGSADITLTVTSIDGTKVTGTIKDTSIPSITSAKITDFTSKVQETVGAQFKTVALNESGKVTKVDNKYTIATTAEKMPFGVMVLHNGVQVFVSTTVALGSIVLDFNSAITASEFKVTYIEQF